MDLEFEIRPCLASVCKGTFKVLKSSKQTTCSRICEDFVHGTKKLGSTKRAVPMQHRQRLLAEPDT